MPKRRTYNVHEAKTQLSKLLKRVSEGQDVYIARAGVPVARLVPVTLPEGERVLGSERGRITFDDDFDAPLPDDLLDAFES
ncbi:MAG TPA: type II toxin-antitoxin system prevent-host-death family antitoxin [Gemmatimonadaceae bacterium]|jgi:prevent-host-death family protein